jgi:hypothetical protein
MIGPFKIGISSVAEKIDVTALSDEERTVLCHGISFDPTKHDCYRFSIVPAPKRSRKNSLRSGWKKRRVSYERTDCVFVKSRSTENGIQF